MLIDRAGVARLIPHAGAMCLLDGVEAYNEMQIRCLTMTHRSADNPLRRDGMLGILAGVEYAAQAMAVHAALNARETGGARQGFLASVRAVQWQVDRLDTIPGALTIQAVSMHAEASRRIYDFSLHEEDRPLLQGRAAVVLE